MSKTHHSLIESAIDCREGQKNDSDYDIRCGEIGMAKGFALYMAGMAAVLLVFAVALVAVLQ
ncbi:hypothetical protein [Pseudomonas asplenii]|uniref:hypothetical protein n=1 Tax=Pseudomonas asplenii TaxID=53407 RepID=UPI0003A4BB01|nr:hypothetical protein [Pseudomonas fuscovaginae]